MEDYLSNHNINLSKNLQIMRSNTRMKMKRAIIIDVRVSIIGMGTVVGLEDLTREPSENTGKR